MSVFGLPAPPAGSSTKAKNVAGTGGHPYTRKVKAAGRAYAQRLRNTVRGRSLSHDSNEAREERRRAANAKEEAWLEKYRNSIKGRKFTDLSMYHQLALTDIEPSMFDATDEQIKKNYHRVLIEHHPDKTGKTEKDPNYLAVQKAFATLTDPKKKRAYDSQVDFDETIPTGKENIKEENPDPVKAAKGVSFYELYGPVFVRNARFSEVKPVPQLGDENTPIDEVNAFYSFWYNFDSWRDFNYGLEHDTDQASSRYEKRMMEKKNEAVAKKKKKDEYNRLTKLVDRAMANDPRLRRIARLEKEAKEAEKAAKEEAKLAEERKIQEAKEAEEHAAAEKAASEKANKDAKKLEKVKLKKAIRKAKKAFRELCEAAREQGAEGALDVVEVETLCDALTELDDLNNLGKLLGGSVDSLNVAGLKEVREILAKHQ